MIHSWTFHSFAMERFCHYFGQSTAMEADQMVAAATWEERDQGKTGLDDVERIIRRVATGGLSYAGLSELEAEILDRHLKVLFRPFGFEESLDVEHESPEPYPHGMELEERVPKGAELRFLPMLRFGWRYDTGDLEPEPGYFILHPEQVQALAAEIDGAIANPAPWSDDLLAEIVDRTLVQVIHSVIAKKKGLAGVLD
jgi:hypothetical protein